MPLQTAIKQTIAFFYWLFMGIWLQIEQPSIPVFYAFAGAIGLGLFVTVIWVISPLFTARVYQERVRELENRLSAVELRLQVTSEQNQVLREANTQYEHDMRDALEHIRRLSADINGLKSRYGETTDC